MEALILSYGLDTNGQNARFVKAAQRFGSDPAVISALAIGNTDPAGVIARFQMASDKLGVLEIRSAHRAEQYFHFPNDLVWDRKGEREIKRLAERADVIHLNNSAMAYKRFRLNKPALLHHHGSLFRNDPEAMFAVAKQYRMVQAVSTIDLLKPDPEQLHWLPTAYNVDELAAFGKANRRKPDGRVRIVHAPTNRELKHTQLVVDVVSRLQGEGLPVDLVLVEGQTWADCMKVKATADIVYDQLAFGYGCNSVEAWGMGIPVIAGADDWTLDRMRADWGGIPFYSDAPSEPTTEETLEDHIRRMAKSADLRAHWGGVGHEHVRKYHDEKPALARLAELYAKAIARHTTVRIPSKGPAVTFRNTGNRPVYVEEQRVEFKGGKVTLTDTRAVEHLRTIARTRPGYGIEEVA